MPITLKRERVTQVTVTFSTRYQVLNLSKPTSYYHLVGAPNLFDLHLVLRRNFDESTQLELPQNGWLLRVPGLHFVQTRLVRVAGTKHLFRYGSLHTARWRFDHFTPEEWERLYLTCLLRIALGPDRDKLTETQLAAAHVASHTIPHERRT